MTRYPRLSRLAISAIALAFVVAASPERVEVRRNGAANHRHDGHFASAQLDDWKRDEVIVSFRDLPALAQTTGDTAIRA